MGILVADRKYLGEIGVLDEGMKVYGGENVELGIRVSKRHLSNIKSDAVSGFKHHYSCHFVLMIVR